VLDDKTKWKNKENNEKFGETCRLIYSGWERQRTSCMLHESCALSNKQQATRDRRHTVSYRMYIHPKAVRFLVCALLVGEVS
jgi:hypothetical protein